MCENLIIIAIMGFNLIGLIKFGLLDCYYNII